MNSETRSILVKLTKSGHINFRKIIKASLLAGFVLFKRPLWFIIEDLKFWDPFSLTLGSSEAQEIWTLERDFWYLVVRCNPDVPPGRPGEGPEPRLISAWWELDWYYKPPQVRHIIYTTSPAADLRLRLGGGGWVSVKHLHILPQDRHIDHTAYECW